MILVTGGTGYIGSHTCVELLNAGYEVVIIDNLSNSKKEVVSYIEKITGKKVPFYENDVCDKDALRKIFSENKIDAIIHFAGYKAVGESVLKPLMYYRNNIDSTLSLLEVSKEYGVKKIVFSSSATVYGKPKTLPIKEDFPLSTTNPYGTTKKFNEIILNDLCKSDEHFSVVLLRYFNPIGAHPSGLLGEVPNGIPNNLVPYIAKVASGELDYLRVFGDDYDTKDGTGVRDYIHVVDLALAHVKAIEYAKNHHGSETINVGSGNGYTVMEVLKAYEKACGKKLPYKVLDRRPGDIATCYADVEKAKALLGFEVKYDIEKMCEDSYNLTLKNPNGIE